MQQQSLLKQFIHFSTATVASLMVFSLYSIVDGLFVARGVGEYAMSAVNLSVPFVNLLFSIAVIFAVGTSTIIAFLLGQKNAQSANKLFSQNLVTLTVLGVIISVLVLVFTEPFALLLGANEDTLEYTVHYLHGLAPFAVCFMISYNLEVLVKTDGRPRLALITVCVIRELLGSGTFGGGILNGGEGIRIIPAPYPAMQMVMPVGGFLVLGCVIAASQWLVKHLEMKNKKKEAAK